MDFHKVYSSTFFFFVFNIKQICLHTFPLSVLSSWWFLDIIKGKSFKYYNYPANKTDQEKEHRQQMLRENAANTNGNKSCEER